MTLPAGLLREPVSAAGRADLVVYTRSPEGDAGGLFYGEVFLLDETPVFWHSPVGRR